MSIVTFFGIYLHNGFISNSFYNAILCCCAVHCCRVGMQLLHWKTSPHTRARLSARLVLSECAHSHTGERPAVCSSLLASTKTNGSWCAVPSRATPRGPSPLLPPPPARRRSESGNGSKLFLDFFYSEKAYITYNTLIFAVEHRCYWFKKPAKKCKSGFISSCLFLYTYLRFIHGALGLYLISIVNVVMHTNSLLSSVLLRAAPRQCGGGEARRGTARRARRGCCSKAQAQRLDSLAVMIPTDSSVDDQRGSHAIRPCRCALTSY